MHKNTEGHLVSIGSNGDVKSNYAKTISDLCIAGSMNSVVEELQGSNI